MVGTDRRVALVTGANRGIGLAVATRLAELGHRVILCGRDPEAARAASEPLAARGLSVEPRRLDVSDPDGDLPDVDVLVNNAGVFPHEGGVMDADAETARATFETNLLGPLRLIQAVLPGMRRRRWGRIVNVSTDMASLGGMGGGNPSYRASKVALNALTRTVAAETRGSGVLVNAVSPGWVQTRMGGGGAPRTVEQGASGIVWAATLPDDGPTGGFFRDGEPLPW